MFEYSIPRMGKRVDNILLFNGIVFVLEFKTGYQKYFDYALDQVLDYALDLKNFHEQSQKRKIVPILITPQASHNDNCIKPYEDFVFQPVTANKNNLADILHLVSKVHHDIDLDVRAWEKSIYRPTPTILEAAQALYKGHTVKEISRSDSNAINLSRTANAIADIIENSKRYNRKSICFITGVPGAGKTLAGLNIANERLHTDEGEHAVFLSGNGPLVQVLQEALARNKLEEQKHHNRRITKKKALSETKAFIQNIHHFRDDNIQQDIPPIERVVIFDEAQRAWTLEQTSRFMRQKKGIHNFELSEPHFLIGVMNRHKNWAVIVCLIGGGQEINKGEAGLPEWFYALHKSYPEWDIYISDKLTDFEYTQGKDLFSLISPDRLHIYQDLHLAVSVRSFRSEKVSAFVKALLDCDVENAKYLYSQINHLYPIVLTRHLLRAQKWLKEKALGTERYGLIASSGACRLKPFGININSKIDPRIWFLNGKEDVRSSYQLEDVATEFDIQGLELDWTCVCWDADFRYNQGHWEYKNFSGTRWININETRQLYLKNAYRVLLTRARQGMIIFIPQGDMADPTRKPEFYEKTAKYLISCGIPLLE